MTIENIGLFQALNTKMNYLAERQKVISQNVANADTPGYAAKDLTKVDFGRLVERITKTSNKVNMATTEAGHQLPQNEAAAAKMQKERAPFEVAPGGNAVILEEQMTKASETQMDYNLMLNLYKSNVDMIRTSLGKRS